MEPQPLDVRAVKRLAVDKGIDTQADLARLAGFSESLLSRILNGQRGCKPSNLLRLADALGCQPADILKESA